jgi:hypothetical protein
VISNGGARPARRQGNPLAAGANPESRLGHARKPKQRSPDPCPCRALSRHPVRRRSLRPSQRHHDTAGLSACGGVGPRIGDSFLV